MKSIDLRTLGTGPGVKPLTADLQQIELKRSCASVENEYSYTLFMPDKPEGVRLWEDKSLRYASHSTRFGIYGPPLLQLSLAMCLRLYSVARAISFHRQFAGLYLLHLPEGTFTKRFIVPLMLSLFMLVGCADRKTMQTMSVNYVVWYASGTWELIPASPLAKLTERGCMVDGGKVIACNVRRIIPQPVKDY